MNSNSGAAGKSPYQDFAHKDFLVIDDMPSMRKVFRDILRGCGANPRRIKTAGSASIALGMLAAQPFDVVLCDFHLGHGRNGMQILEEAKVRELVGPACAWIMVTAEKTAEVVTGTAEYRPDAYLVKPITEAMLRQRLARIWTRKRSFIPIAQAMQRGDFLQAIRLCDEHMAVDKANWQDLARTRADLLVKMESLAQARQAYEAVLAERDYPWARAGLARTFIREGELAAAQSLLETTLGDAPYYLEAHDLLAETHLARGELEAAERALEQAARLSPNSVHRQKNLGKVALQLERFERAELAFRKSLALGEHSVLKAPDAYLGLAKACSAQEKPDEALRVLGQLNRAFSDEGTRLQSLGVEGLVHHRAGNAIRAEAIAAALEEEMEKKGGFGAEPFPLDAGRLFLAVGKREAALQFVQGQVRSQPDNAQLLEEAKGLLSQAGMGEEALARLEASRQEGMEFMNRGVLLARDGRYGEAIATMREARQAMPANLRVLFNSASVLIACMQKTAAAPELLDEARAALRRAHELAPGQPRHADLAAALADLESMAKTVE